MFIGDFISEWFYYGVLTVILEVILFLLFKIAANYYQDYRTKKFLSENPEIANLLDKFSDMEMISEDVHQVPLISYLVYPKSLDMNTENTLVCTTLQRARDFAEDHDEILQIMFYPPDESEQRYHKSDRARQDRAIIVKKLFDGLNTEEDSNDESPT